MNDLRVSDRDREAVVARLFAAAGEGRLTLAEVDDRSGQAYAAKTYRELEALVADLPSAGRDHRSLVVDHTGLALSLLALAGGVAWIPLFPHLDFGAFCGAVGVVFGMFGMLQALTLFAVRWQSWDLSAAQLGLLCKSPGSLSTP